MWFTIIPLLVQGLSAIQPLSSGADTNGISAAGAGLVPVIQALAGAFAPGSQAKVEAAVSVVTSVYDPDIGKWIQKVLNLVGSNLEVDGKLGPQSLAAADSFAERELGIIPGGLMSEVLQNSIRWLADKQLPVPSTRI
jgi:hypothetical protein